MTNFSEPHQCAPQSVQVLRVLGHGRAARAQLVEATFADGGRIQCVEKVFAAGWLTRMIYRIAFQSPFAYQTNLDAITASYYRRRVAAAALQLSDLDADVAMPLYVRYDESASAWVLAAKWIDGRGLKPPPADDHRLRRSVGRIWRWLIGRRQTTEDALLDQKTEAESEIDQLIRLMHGLEETLAHCGLIGSGWQVSPGALVSTANLLRTKSVKHQKDSKQYTIIDLESGIPAVLVPRYVIAGARRGIMPMFEDIDATQLRGWLRESERLLTFRIGPAALRQLESDVHRLIEHTQRWKASEVALSRRPWRFLTTSGVEAYQQETFRRWRQTGVVDDQTAEELCSRPFFAALLWWLGCLPTSLGKRVQRLVGNQRSRFSAKQFLRDRDIRRLRLQAYTRKCQARWQAAKRIPSTESLSIAAVMKHRILQSTTFPRWHRWIVDPDHRRLCRRQMLLAMFSSRYQSWLGKQHMEASITKWQDRQRITAAEAQGLRQSLHGEHVRVYARGFGMHLGLKAIGPMLGPAKLGGLAAYIAGGSVWFLLIPFALTPMLRSLITMASLWSMRNMRVPHAEALIVGLLPTVGTLAFPLQMFTSHRDLSIFLIRDAAARLGRHLPIYGGPDSRTEMATIRAADYLLEIMTMMTGMLANLRRFFFDRSVSRSAAEAPAVLSFQHHNTIWSRTKAGRRIDELAVEQIKQAERKCPDQKGSQQDRSPSRIVA